MKSIKIDYILSSRGHNYFTRKKFDVGEYENIEHSSVTLREGFGIEGDRFEHSKYPLTLFSLEVAKDVCQSLDILLDVKLFRRNIVLSGVENLNDLIGKKFSIGNVEFFGVAHCPPCPWMNAVMKKGAYALMRSRGGLRVEVTKGGKLSLGEQSFEVF